MSYLVLARKYRPQTFDQVVQQAHVTRTLTNAITSGRVAHAILFAGPRGTGKTTVARILAKAMNCEQGPTPQPCNVCRSCREITAGNAADVYEIDGASNNSVEQVRELRENLQYMPSHSPRKIYIIDEVHMLSLQAFNALLKTLEEPPAHVMFLFATTEPHKIPVTILSRCQRHDLRRIDLRAIADHLQMLCRRQEVVVQSESLWLIAREAGGSMRDALSLLDQVIASADAADGIDPREVLDILGVIDRKILHDIAGVILNRDLPAVLGQLDEIYDRGHDMKKLHGDLLEHFRNLLVAKIGRNPERLIDLPGHELAQLQSQVADVPAERLEQVFELLLREEGALKYAAQPRLVLEMAFVRMLQASPVLPIEVLIAKIDQLRQGLAELPVGTPPPQSLAPREEVALPASPPVSSPPAASAVEARYEPNESLAQSWQHVLEKLSGRDPALKAVLAASELLRVDAAVVEIQLCGSTFSLDRARRKESIALIEALCSDYFGGPRKLVLRTKELARDDEREKQREAARLKHEALHHPLVSEAIEVFEGQVVEVKIL
ncbi:MAG: DNA polymerase III subunit gamma/tau [Desulfobacteraceae bacterium]|nr:DNA polymerase III subunit gamma/tau [Desulfobacteraceae bacterium]